MKSLSLSLCLGLICAIGTPASARLLNVPDDHETIQGAINATEDGDTVLVQPGRYVENIDFDGHNIVVGSLYLTTGDTSFVGRTTLQGDSTTSVVQFGSGENASTALSGFTVQRGHGIPGGGIFIRRSSPLLDHLLIRGNNGGSLGGGIYMDRNSSPIIRNTTIMNNTAAIAAGVYCTENCAPVFTMCSIISNHAVNGGGGISMDTGCDVILADVTISRNTASNGGAGITVGAEGHGREAASTLTLRNGLVASNVGADDSNGGGISCLTGSTILIERSTIRDNRNGARSYGGGLYISDECDVTIVDSRITGNFTPNPGGGMYIDFGSNVTLNHVLIENNTSSSYAGGIAIGTQMNGPTVNLINVTLTGNSAPERGGLWLTNGSIFNIVNGIIRDNSPQNIYVSRTLDENRLIVSHTNLQGGQEGIEDNHNLSIDWLDGNIDSDPLFVDPDNGDYHLTEDSPCIDTGDPDARPDPDGSRADMGAFYFHQDLPRPIIFVEPDTLDFGVVRSGQYQTDTVWVRNFGQELLSVENVAITDVEVFLFDSGDDPFELANGEAHAIVIGVLGDEPARYTSTLRITSNDPVNEVIEISLVAEIEIMVPNLETNLDTLLFSHLAPWQEEERELILRNTGDIELRIFSLNIEPNFVPFRIVSGAEVAAIEPDSSWTLVVRFSPRSAEEFSADLLIESDDPAELLRTIHLSGSAALGVTSGDAYPTEFGIVSLSPNPFNSSTLLIYEVPNPADIRLSVFDQTGREVSRLVDERMPVGRYEVTFDAGSLPAGIYFARLEAGGERRTVKMALVR